MKSNSPYWEMDGAGGARKVNVDREIATIGECWGIVEETSEGLSRSIVPFK